MACIFSHAKKCLSTWGPLTTFLLPKINLMKIQRISWEKFKEILSEVYSTSATPYLHQTIKKLMNWMQQFAILLGGPVAKLKPEKSKFTSRINHSSIMSWRARRTKRIFRRCMRLRRIGGWKRWWNLWINNLSGFLPNKYTPSISEERWNTRQSKTW